MAKANFNPSDDRFTRGIIRRKIKQLIGRAGFTKQDRDDLEQETGTRPGWEAAAFTDLDADVRSSIARIVADPYVPHTDSIRGFVFDVATGRLREVGA